MPVMLSVQISVLLTIHYFEIVKIASYGFKHISLREITTLSIIREISVLLQILLYVLYGTKLTPGKQYFQS
jgi:hypothetical protein